MLVQTFPDYSFPLHRPLNESIEFKVALDVLVVSSEHWFFHRVNHNYFKIYLHCWTLFLISKCTDEGIMGKVKLSSIP